MPAHEAFVLSIAHAPDGRRAYSGSVEGDVLLWEPGKGEASGCLRGHAGPVRDLAVTVDGRAVFSASKDGTIRVWDATTGACVRTLEVPGAGGAFAVAVAWPLAAIGLLGVMGGPVEAIMVTVGGGSVAGFCQHLSLHRTGLASGGWLLRWVAGLVAGAVVMTAIFVVVVGPLGISLSWPAEIFTKGFVVGGVAAIISGNTLFRLFAERTKNEAVGR